jgi:hypothetical protein
MPTYGHVRAWQWFSATLICCRASLLQLLRINGASSSSKSGSRQRRARPWKTAPAQGAPSRGRITAAS